MSGRAAFHVPELLRIARLLGTGLDELTKDVMEKAS